MEEDPAGSVRRGLGGTAEVGGGKPPPRGPRGSPANTHRQGRAAAAVAQRQEEGPAVSWSLLSPGAPPGARVTGNGEGALEFSPWAGDVTETQTRSRSLSSVQGESLFLQRQLFAFLSNRGQSMAAAHAPLALALVTETREGKARRE